MILLIHSINVSIEKIFLNCHYNIFLIICINCCNKLDWYCDSDILACVCPNNHHRFFHFTKIFVSITRSFYLFFLKAPYNLAKKFVLFFQMLNHLKKLTKILNFKQVSYPTID